MNKNGWGLRFELFFIAIFLVCLLIATIGLNKMNLLGNSDDSDLFGNVKDTTMYNGYESDLRKAALNYYNNKYANSNDTIVIKTSTLYQNGYLSVMYDTNGKECSGYAKVFSNKSVSAYIKCSKYKTDGYSKNNE